MKWGFLQNVSCAASAATKMTRSLLEITICDNYIQVSKDYDTSRKCGAGILTNPTYTSSLLTMLIDHLHYLWLWKFRLMKLLCPAFPAPLVALGLVLGYKGVKGGLLAWHVKACLACRTPFNFEMHPYYYWYLETFLDLVFFDKNILHRYHNMVVQHPCKCHLRWARYPVNHVFLVFLAYHILPIFKVSGAIIIM